MNLEKENLEVNEEEFTAYCDSLYAKCNPQQRGDILGSAYTRQDKDIDKDITFQVSNSFLTPLAIHQRKESTDLLNDKTSRCWNREHPLALQRDVQC